jgi:hypothetical protein
VGGQYGRDSLYTLQPAYSGFGLGARSFQQAGHIGGLGLDDESDRTALDLDRPDKIARHKIAASRACDRLQPVKDTFA